MTPRCCLKDCIATAVHSIVDNGVCWDFCERHHRYFDAFLAGLREERDRMVENGVSFQMANRIITERVNRECDEPDG